MREDYDNPFQSPPPPPPPPRAPGVLLPIVLFVVTVVTTVIAGALYEGAPILTDPGTITYGIPFSFSLLLILGTHEFGHYIASRRHGVIATLPYFIPGPPLPPMIGTFGAVIKLKSPILTKRALVDIGAAGPLAGFVVSVFVVLFGLTYSHVGLIPPAGEGLGLGSSIIFNSLTYITFGPIPEGYDVYLHSVAFAGWIGFFVTALNLLPMGQLDGGHLVYALVGTRHRKVSFAMVALLVVLGYFTWPGWILWAVLVTIIGIWHPPVGNPDVPLDPLRRLVSLITLFVFILTFTPTPFYIY